MLGISSNHIYNPLFSTQEKADTKVIAHTTEFLDQDSSNKVIMRLPSGDTGIILLCVALLRRYLVIIDNASGKARTSIWLVHLEWSSTKCASVLCKDKCWKLLENHEKFEENLLMRQDGRSTRRRIKGRTRWQIFHYHHHVQQFYN